MKRFFAVFMTVVLLLAMTGCANTQSDGGAANKGNKSDVSQNAEDQGSAGNDKASGDFTKEQSGKILVAYYSATGTTEKIAKTIAEFTNADVFVIEPETPYTSDDLDWTDDNSRVSIEHNVPDHRDVALKAVTPEHFEDYDIVLIGFPIWWGSAAWPVDNFVKANDFTGKMVIPFCTAASSDIGESGNLLAQMAGTGDWQQGRRFYNSSSADEVSGWLKSFHLN